MPEQQVATLDLTAAVKLINTLVWLVNETAGLRGQVEQLSALVQLQTECEGEDDSDE